MCPFFTITEAGVESMGTFDISFVKVYLKSVPIFKSIRIFPKLQLFNVHFDWIINLKANSVFINRNRGLQF